MCSAHVAFGRFVGGSKARSEEVARVVRRAGLRMDNKNNESEIGEIEMFAIVCVSIFMSILQGR